MNAGILLYRGTTTTTDISFNAFLDAEKANCIAGERSKVSAQKPRTMLCTTVLSIDMNTKHNSIGMKTKVKVYYKEFYKRYSYRDLLALIIHIYLKFCKLPTRIVQLLLSFYLLQGLLLSSNVRRYLQWGD